MNYHFGIVMLINDSTLNMWAHFVKKTKRECLHYNVFFHV